jgi:uncharacterized protein YbaR (Trm112 family)
MAQEARNAGQMDQVLDLLACPVCGGGLRAEAAGLACEGCGRVYPIEDGIPILLAGRATAPAQP